MEKKEMTREEEIEYIAKEQQIMEDFFKDILNSPSYQEDTDSLLYHLSPKLESCSFEKKEVQFKYKIKPWQLNPQRGLHGGMSCAMLDTTMGMLAMYFANGSFVSTINLTVNYLRPIPDETEVITRVKSVSWGRTIVSLEGDIYIPATDTVACTSIGTYIVLKGKPAQIPVTRED